MITAPEEDDCTYEGETFPYPGNCHLYYICLDEDDDGDYEVVVFDCGELVYDPNQGACVFPDEPEDLLCGPGEF